MSDETPKEEVKNKPWYKKFKVVAGIATVVLDVATILISQFVSDPATSALIMKLMVPVTAVGVSIITGHAITDAASALKK
jgi:hypothetical protein